MKKDTEDFIFNCVMFVMVILIAIFSFKTGYKVAQRDYDNGSSFVWYSPDQKQKELHLIEVRENREFAISNPLYCDCVSIDVQDTTDESTRGIVLTRTQALKLNIWLDTYLGSGNEFFSDRSRL